MPNLDRETRAAVATPLLHRLHGEVLTNLTRDAEDRGLLDEPMPADRSRPIAHLVDQFPELVADESHHIDLSHLSTTLTFARSADQVDDWQQALDLAEYGAHLSATLLLPAEEPFVDFYPMHVAYFRALLDIDADTNLSLFAELATTVDPMQSGTMAAETYIDLLTRLQRYAMAADASAKLLAPGMATLGIAPTLLEVSSMGDDYSAYLAAAKSRGDLLGLAQGLIGQKSSKDNALR